MFFSNDIFLLSSKLKNDMRFNTRMQQQSLYSTVNRDFRRDKKLFILRTTSNTTSLITPLFVPNVSIMCCEQMQSYITLAM